MSFFVYLDALHSFSCRGPDGMMDPGFTEHSGCPVLEGEKWITTAWMREGTIDLPNLF